MRTIDYRVIDDIGPPDQVKCVALDLEDETSIRAAAKEIAAISSKKLDILVNNAGMASGELFQMMPLNELRRAFEVNFFGQVSVAQRLTRFLSGSESGSIINIASTAADIADPGTLAYGSTKAALIRATRSMAVELGPLGIRVNAISPGITKTDMFDEMDSRARDRLIGTAALGRAAEPQEIADVALFFASGLSKFVTGQVLRVDGGMS